MMLKLPRLKQPSQEVRMRRSEHEQICKPLAESKAETSDTQRKKRAPVKTALVDSATKERRESTVQSPILPEIATSHQRLKPAEDSAQEFLYSLSCNCIFLSHLATFSQYCSFLILGLYLLFPTVYSSNIVYKFSHLGQTFSTFP